CARRADGYYFDYW
nr:immunoglobulin heavy chain junction region [Mus musculus]